MAGIFAFSSIGLPSSPFLLVFCCVNLWFVCLLSRSEADFKRVVAFSTVVLVGLIWILILQSANYTTLSVCAFHAAYKSALFVTIGRLLVVTATYGDQIFNTRSAGTSNLLVPAIFLMGFRNSSYASAKHGIDAALWMGSSVNFVLIFVVSANLLVFWSLGIRFNGNRKSKAAISLLDFVQLPINGTLVLAVLVSGTSIFASGNGLHLSASGIGF